MMKLYCLTDILPIHRMVVLHSSPVGNGDSWEEALFGSQSPLALSPLLPTVTSFLPSSSRSPLEHGLHFLPLPRREARLSFPLTRTLLPAASSLFLLLFLFVGTFSSSSTEPWTTKLELARRDQEVEVTTPIKLWSEVGGPRLVAAVPFSLNQTTAELALAITRGRDTLHGEFKGVERIVQRWTAVKILTVFSFSRETFRHGGALLSFITDSGQAGKVVVRSTVGEHWKEMEKLAILAPRPVGALMVGTPGPTALPLELIKRGIIWVTDLLSEIAHRIISAWQEFILGRETVSAPVTGNIPQPAIDREALKKEVTAEVLKDLAAQGVVPGPVPAAWPNAGLVLMPTTGSSSLDRLKQNLIQNSFSDQVKVSLDPNGRTGLIEPIFRSGTGASYLFVITPVGKP